MGNLNNLYISQSFQSLAHLGTDNALVPGNMTILQDGIGQSLNISFDGTNISSSGNIYAANITASQIDTGSLVTTASFNAYSQSTSTTITNLSASLTITDKFLQDQITALDVSGAAVSLVLFNQFTASQLIINSDYNSFTASSDIRLDNLEATSASVNVSIANLNTTTASLNTSITNLNLSSASQQVSINSLNSKTGSYATTGSNTFIGDQTISGSLFVSGSEVLTGPLTASRLQVLSNTSLGGTLSVSNDTTMTGDLLIQSTSPKLKLRDTSGGGFSSGYDLTIDTGSFIINDETHDRPVLSDIYNTSTLKHTTELTSEIIVISGSTSVTLIGNVSASIISASTINGLGDPLAFSSSVASQFASITGSSINTGSFATTGSNTFIGNQTITGKVYISSSQQQDLVVEGQLWVSSSATAAATQPRITISGSAGQTIINRNNLSTRNTTNVAQLNPAAIFTNVIATADEIGFSVDTAATPNWSLGPSIYVNDTGDTYPAVIGFQNKANYTDGRVAVLTPLSASAGFTASLQTGYVWVGNVAGQNSQVATSSFATSAITASSLITASATGNTITFTKGDASTFDLTLSGASIDTASFATTGSNNFVGNQSIVGTLYISSSTQNDVIVNGQVFISSSATAAATQPRLTVSGSSGQSVINRNSITVRNTTDNAGIYPSTIFTGDLATTDEIGFTVDPSVFGITNWSTGPAIYVQNPSDTYPAAFGFENKANYTDGRVTALTPFIAQSGLRVFGNSSLTGSLLVSGAIQTTQDMTIEDASGNPTLKIGRGAGNQPSNLRFGVQALATAPGLNNIAIGNSAMQYSSQSLATENIALGGESLQYTQEGQQIAIGTSALRYTTTGKENLAVGAFAMQNNITGTQNIAVGFNSLYNHTDGTRNIAIGPSAAQNFRSGSNNIFIGYQTGNSISGSNNVILGAYNGTGETINNNIILSDGDGNIKLQSSSSVWTTNDSLVVSSSLSVGANIKMGRGTDKPTNKVTVGSGGLIVSNSLVTADSYIFATSDTTVGNYSPVVSNITAGSFSLSNGGYAGNISVMYMIVNPY